MKTKSKNKSFVSRLGRLFRNLVLLFFATSIGWVILARFVPVYVTPLMFIRSVEALAAGEVPRNSKDWVSIDKISALSKAYPSYFLDSTDFIKQIEKIKRKVYRIRM